MRWIIHVIIPIFIGGLIYLCFRSNNLLMFKWLEIAGLNESANTLQSNASAIRGKLPDWIIFSLPDGLWVYAFMSALLILWNGQLTIWLLIPLFAGVVLEIAQASQIFIGTFDYIDLLLSILAFLGSILIHKYINKKQHEKTVY